MRDLDNPHYRPKHRDFSSETESNLKHKTIFVIKAFNYQVLSWLKTSYSGKDCHVHGKLTNISGLADDSLSGDGAAIDPRPVCYLEH